MDKELLTVEVRLRFRGDGMEWKDRPVFTTIEVRRQGTFYVVDLSGGYVVTTSSAIKAIAIEEGAVESRWNFKGSGQGHYNFI